MLHVCAEAAGIAGEITTRLNERVFEWNERVFEWSDAPINRVELDSPIPYASPLEDHVLPQVEDVIIGARYLAGY